MNRYSPGDRNVTTVVTGGAGRDADLVGARAVVSVGAAAMAGMERRVADQPLVVDRVAVGQDDRDRNARADDDPIRGERRVAHPDLDPAARQRRRTTDPRQGDPGDAQPEQDAAEESEADARSPARRVARHVDRHVRPG